MTRDKRNGSALAVIVITKEDASQTQSQYDQERGTDTQVSEESSACNKGASWSSDYWSRGPGEGASNRYSRSDSTLARDSTSSETDSDSINTPTEKDVSKDEDNELQNGQKDVNDDQYAEDRPSKHSDILSNEQSRISVQSNGQNNEHEPRISQTFGPSDKDKVFEPQKSVHSENDPRKSDAQDDFEDNKAGARRRFSSNNGHSKRSSFEGNLAKDIYSKDHNQADFGRAPSTTGGRRLSDSYRGEYQSQQGLQRFSCDFNNESKTGSSARNSTLRDPSQALMLDRKSSQHPWANGQPPVAGTSRGNPTPCEELKSSITTPRQSLCLQGSRTFIRKCTDRANTLDSVVSPQQMDQPETISSSKKHDKAKKADDRDSLACHSAEKNLIEIVIGGKPKSAKDIFINAGIAFCLFLACFLLCRTGNYILSSMIKSVQDI